MVQLLPQQLDGLAEALEMDNLPLTEELDHVVHIRVIGQAQDVIIGHSCFLLCHVDINTAKIHRYFGGKRLILTDNDFDFAYIFLQIIGVQAIWMLEYRIRLGSKSHRKRLG